MSRPLSTAHGHLAGAPRSEISSTGMRVASLEFSITPIVGGSTASKVRAVVKEVAGPLKTAVTLLEDGDKRVCLITPHMNSPKGANTSPLLRQSVAEVLDLPVSHVLIMVSHNHTDINLVSNNVESFVTLGMAPADIPEPVLEPIGQVFLNRLVNTVRQLPALMQPVTVWWAEGSEGRISYNRKGRRADGTAYFIREDDRDLLGTDYNGDIDRQAPIIVFKNEADEVVTAITQFTAHPISCYNPERPVIFGEWPQVACEHVARHLSPDKPIAVSFLQGCAADMNSKGMLRGDVELSRKYGRMLADTYIAALDQLRPSHLTGLEFKEDKVRIPLAPLPPVGELEAEISEMRDFILRAKAGDEDTLDCVGLNLPAELTPAYRARLIEMVLPWSEWALGLHQQGRAHTVAKYLEVEFQVLRIGDIGIVGMPFEPFLGLGRQVRSGSDLPLNLTCGYTNHSYGYLTDGANTGDGDYPSAHYRYSKFRPPYAKPAGDLLANKAIETLNQMASHESSH